MGACSKDGGIVRPDILWEEIVYLADTMSTTVSGHIRPLDAVKLAEKICQLRDWLSDPANHLNTGKLFEAMTEGH
jgi:hypothetical protein